MASARKLYCNEKPKRGIPLDIIHIRIAIRRFLELLVTCAVISTVITLLYAMNLLITDFSLRLALITGVVIFILSNVWMLRQCYFEMKSNLIYFLVNISAYLLFAAVCLIIYFLCSKYCFTWMFAITKFVRFSTLGFETFHSVLTFHALGLLMVLLAPIGMGWVFLYDEDEE